MTKRRAWLILIVCLRLAVAGWGATWQGPDVVFETTSPYHHIQVVDLEGMRTLHFDDSTQSRMSLEDALQGHFEYTEYFHMPWLWNGNIKTALMIGLGGGSIQRAYERYYPQVQCETVELDPKVVEVAREYFHFKESKTVKVIVGDGRVHLRRTQSKYDVILLDAYTASRYGSFIPYALVTREFFALANEHLTEHGVLAYNVIGSVYGGRQDIVSAVYKTLRTSFAQVYLFPAAGSRNVVIVATKSAEPMTLSQLNRKADELIESKKVTFPSFKARLQRLRTRPPLGAEGAQLLTDDFAPVDGLLKTD